MDHLLSDFGRRLVREMPVATEDSLLHAPRSAGFLKEFHVVIGFEDENVRLTNPLNHQFGRMPEVGQTSERDFLRLDDKTNGIDGVVRDGEGSDRAIADIKGIPGLKQTEAERARQFFRDGFFCVAVAIDRNLEPGSEGCQTLDVIRMLVRDQDAMQSLRRAADRGEPGPDLAATESGIHQQTGFVGLKEGAVSTGTAAEDRDSRRHGSNRRLRSRSGQMFPGPMAVS